MATEDMESYKVLHSVLAVLALVLVCCQNVLGDQNLTETNKSHRALSVFQVVRFPNTGCAGSSSMNGTCFTSSECTNNGGVSSGTCANGFGVCCVFTLGCGSVARQNCTYFQSTSIPKSGNCGVTVCKCSSDICQLRIDFNTFVIAGPNTLTSSIGTQLFGQPTTAGGTGVDVTPATQCSTDQFTITGPAGSTPPVICGTNTGQHVYVDASDLCNQMNFMLGANAIGIATIPTRSWNLKISQISCFDSTGLAPSGCTQYYTGTSGKIQSFNWLTNGANSVQLANQNQRICFRREKGFCRICFAQAASIDFSISGTNVGSKLMGFTSGSVCCGYGNQGLGSQGYDCVMIPGASTADVTRAQIANSFCGAAFVTLGGLTISTFANTRTVCTTKTPFELSFITDMYTALNTQKMGFMLQWKETAC